MSKFNLKSYVAGLLTMTFLFSSTLIFAETQQTIDAIFGRVKLVVNGNVIDKETLLYSGTTYVPLRAAAEALNKEVIYESNTNIAYINDKKINAISKETNTQNTSQNSSTSQHIEPNTSILGQDYYDSMAQLEKDLAELDNINWDDTDTTPSQIPSTLNQSQIPQLSQTQSQQSSNPTSNNNSMNRYYEYKVIIDNQKAQISSEKSSRYHSNISLDYEQELNRLQNKITNIQDKIFDIQFNNSFEIEQKRNQLQNELSNAQKELDNFVNDHSIKQQLDALDSELERYRQN